VKPNLSRLPACSLGRSLRSTIKAHGVGSKTAQRIKADLTDETTTL